MEGQPAQEWSAELAAELQRLSGLLGQDAPKVRLAAGERRHVAVLFLDLKDYTSLAERLDHETLHHLVRSLMGLLAREVEVAGGYVDKYEGDMIMALFGAGGPSEVPCQRAVSCGLKMLERVASAAGILGRRGISLAARVGVSYGPVTVAPDPSGHLTATGDEVIVASRLQSHAPDGGLLASAAAHRAAGDYFSWKDQGEKVVRGRSSPVHTYQALGPGPLRMSWWREAARCASVPFVDRAEEIGRLTALLQGEGDCSVALVTGDPGSGKTALAGEVVSRLAGDGGPKVITGRSMAYDQPPYRLWTEVLRDIARPSKPLDHLQELLGDDLSYRMEMAGDLLESLVSGSFDGGFEEGPGDSDGLVAGLVRDALAAQAERSSGLILLLDDLQWLDSRSASVLRILLEEGFPASVRVLLISREQPEQLEGTSVVELPLEGLETEALEELAGHLLGGRCGLVPEEISLLARRTAEAVGGYPLYFRDMILYLLESGGLEAACGEGGLTALLRTTPGTLSSLVASRFDQLQEKHRRMLQFASVLGQVFPEDLLACYLEGIRSETSAGLPEDFNGALSLLVDAKLLRRRRTPDAETVSFRTPLARRVAYNTLLLHNRRILHGIAAAACLETASRAPRRSGMAARHLKLAGDGAEAMKHGLVRLKQAAGGYQTTETISWSDQLLDWAAEAGSGARAETLLEIMDHRRGALELEGRIAECRKTLERMMSLARSHGLPRWRTRVLIGQGSLMSVTGAPRKALELLEAGARMAGAHGCRDLLALALSNQASCRIRLGDLEEAEDNISAALRAADAVDDPTLAARCLLVRSQLEMSTGRLGPAEKTLRELLSREGGASVRIRMAATANLGAVLSGTGREREAERSFLEAMRGAESIGDRRVQASCLCNLAALRRRLGDPEAALESLRIALPLARRIDDDNLEGEVLLNMGTALADAGDSNGAFSRSLEAFELLRRLGGSRHLGLALRNAAVFAERAERREHLPKLMDAIDSARELLGPEERAQALVLAARAARRMGLMLRASQLVGTARGCLSGGGGLLLAEIHALQGICHLAGGSREEAGRALSKAESLLGEDSPKEDLEADLLELRKNLREE